MLSFLFNLVPKVFHLPTSKGAREERLPWLNEDSCLTNYGLTKGTFYPGLFQASLVISYTTYLINVVFPVSLPLSWAKWLVQSTRLFYIGYDQNTGLGLQGIVSGVFLFLMLIYANFSTAISASKLSKFTCQIKSILSKRPLYTVRGKSYLSSNSFSRVVLCPNIVTNYGPKYGYECS